MVMNLRMAIVYPQSAHMVLLRCTRLSIQTCQWVILRIHNLGESSQIRLAGLCAALREETMKFWGQVWT